MTWSYDPTNLTEDTASGRLNVVRLLIGDTDTLHQQLQDSEINFALSQSNDNIYSAGYWACNTLVSKYSRMVTTQLDGALSSNYSDLIQHYLLLSRSMQYQGRSSGASIGVFAGGITKSSVEAARANTNRVENAFRMDQFKNPPNYETPEYS